MSPYCEAVGCHNAHTAYYVPIETHTPGHRRMVVYLSPPPGVKADRLCRSHALLRYGTAFG